MLLLATKGHTGARRAITGTWQRLMTGGMCQFSFLRQCTIVHRNRHISQFFPVIFNHYRCFSAKAALQNASSPAANLNTPSYSYIIVGAGSAGCVLANRLSEDTNESVLLLEAGPKDMLLGSLRLSWKIHMPAALTYNLCDEKYNWYYHTLPQAQMNNRVMYWPRGRVWGGSSSLNAMVYIRGHAEDYNRWQKEGAEGWDYEHCLPYFRKAQCHELGENRYRGGDGPLHVSRGKTNHPLHKAFIEAGQQAGYPYTDDMNGHQQEGLGWMDMTIYKGKRWSTASAYLRPTLGRPNLKAEVGCLTTKILFEGNVAVGVEYTQNGEKKKVYADKEVILSGGAINSPQLLMLSGVGNADDLKRLDIPVVQHLPGVGSNLQDHLELYVQQQCTQPITLYKAQKPFHMVKIGLEWLSLFTGYGATAHLESGGFIRSRPHVTHPDIQFHFLPSQVIDHGRVASKIEAYQVHVGPMRSTSVGWMKLKSNNPLDHPILQPNYLSTGKRWSTASAYLRPTLGRPNLKAEVGCLTTKILFEGNVAVGVEYTQNGEKKKVYADKEVILSGGAINSPQLLMLSGVGNADDLKRLDIPVVQHLPGVGSNLQDHLELYVQQQCTQPITLYKAQKPFHMVKIGLEWLSVFTGYGATAHLESGGFIRSRPHVTHPDIQFHFLPSQVIDHGRVASKIEAYQVHVGPMRSTSVGWMKLKSNNPLDHPILQPNYLSTDIDVWEFRECVKLAREIFAQKAFDPFRGPEVQPGPHVQSDADLDAFVRQKADSAYHPSCTCKMGSPSDAMAVVDPSTRVLGLERLRVVDASIMPSVVSGNLNAPTIMIAEKAADMIRGHPPLVDPGVPVYQPKTLDKQR